MVLFMRQVCSISLHRVYKFEGFKDELGMPIHKPFPLEIGANFISKFEILVQVDISGEESSLNDNLHASLP